ncbi:alcohol dehydrogenase catalytic domain-containing protein [Parasphingorhabdus sp.]|uniref:alcohol dehydrogenase catalytic domain-containing protein n=1 Tax=Parasphingorhabdus sp. TaxID=2709688 RepID=UPI003A91CE22
MKAAVFHKAGEPLRIEEVADPAPKGNEVVVQVGRCGICTSDLHLTEEHEGSLMSGLFPPGSILGHEFAGEIVAIGPDVTGLAIGDHVAPLAVSGCGHCENCRAGDLFFCANMAQRGGGYGEYALAQADALIRLPAGLSLQDGALVEPLACGLHAARLSGVRPGSKVMVTGVGPIGLATIYWAKRLGASDIVAVARTARRSGLATEMGATRFLTADGDVPAKVAEALGGAPDIVFECAGQVGLVGQSIMCVRPRGTILVVGMCTHPDPVPHFYGAMKEVRIQYAVGYSLKDFQDVADALHAGRTEPSAMVTQTVSFGAFPDIFDALRGATPHVKVMLDPMLSDD